MAAGGQHLRPIRLLYFVAVGLGYILVEIAFIQRFVLFLGHPVYALTVVVFLLLLSSGAGSMVSRWWLAETRRVWLPLLLIAAALLLYVVVLPGRAEPAGRPALYCEAPGQRRIAGAVGFRHGHAISHRACGPWPAERKVSFLVSQQRNGWQSSGVGLGDERGIQRPGLGLGNHDRHPIWIEYHFGLWRRRLFGGTRAGCNAASSFQSGVNQVHGLL